MMMMMMVSSLRAHPLRMPPLWRPLFASSLSVLFFFTAVSFSVYLIMSCLSFCALLSLSHLSLAFLGFPNVVSVQRCSPNWEVHRDSTEGLVFIATAWFLCKTEVRGKDGVWSCFILIFLTHRSFFSFLIASLTGRLKRSQHCGEASPGGFVGNRRSAITILSRE